MSKRYEKHYGQLVGRTIVKVRPMSPSEVDDYYWQGDSESAWVFILDNGQALVPMRDPEGNGPGHLDIVATEPHPAKED